MYALNLAEDGRILSATYPLYATADAVTVESLPEGDIADYLYQDGGIVYDPLPKPEPPAESGSVTLAEMEAARREGVNSV